MSSLVIVLLLIGFIVGSSIFIKRSFETKFLKSLPKSLKDSSEKFVVNNKLLKKIEFKNRILLTTAKSKFLMERGPARILENKDVHEYIEKYINIYFDDFSDEIADGRLDWNNENTKLFFELLNHKFKITPRALLKTLLYLRHEIDYFTFRDSIAVRKPKSIKELLKQSIKYSLVNEKSYVDVFFIKRALCEFGLSLPFSSIPSMMAVVKKQMELEHFDKDFGSRKERVTESSRERLARVSWEEFLAIATGTGIVISESEYIISPNDHSRDSRLDRFFKNRLKFALIEHFQGKCVDCGSGGDLELDHFWQAKSKGGNFAMRSKQGFYVNNCIPLCRSCNASKGAKSIYEYFEGEKIQGLLKANLSFGPFLNAHLQKFDDDQFETYECHMVAVPSVEEKKKAS